jgi:hypothetical protein
MSELEGKWRRKALHWAKYTCCNACAEMRYCHGRGPEQLVCLECFSVNGRVARPPRGGQKGKRKQYVHRSRRPKAETIRLVALLHGGGKMTGAIADELGLSDATVRKYLAMGASAKNGAATPLSMRQIRNRKEQGDSSPAGAFWSPSGASRGA